jgi:hypothetical protein
VYSRAIKVKLILYVLFTNELPDLFLAGIIADEKMLTIS